MNQPPTEFAQRVCPACQSRRFAPLFVHHDRLHGLGGEFTVIRCQVCGTVSYAPLPDEAELARYYPSDYYAYRDGADDDPRPGTLRGVLDDVHLGLRRSAALRVALWPLLQYKEVYSYARFLRDVPRGRLLDVGCGEGGFLRKASRMGFDVEGLEPGATSQEAFSKSGIPLHTCALEELDEARVGRYDLVTLNHVFEHLLQPAHALDKLRRLVRDDGRVLIRMPHVDHVFFRRLPRHWYPLEMPRHVYIYTPAGFARMARRLGWAVESVQYESFPTHLQLLLKSLIFRRDFGQPHWIDRGAFSFGLLPVCAALRWLGQGDCMAVWLRPRR